MAKLGSSFKQFFFSVKSKDLYTVPRHRHEEEVELQFLRMRIQRRLSFGPYSKPGVEVLGLKVQRIMILASLPKSPLFNIHIILNFYESFITLSTCNMTSKCFGPIVRTKGRFFSENSMGLKTIFQITLFYLKFEFSRLFSYLTASSLLR